MFGNKERKKGNPLTEAYSEGKGIFIMAAKKSKYYSKKDELNERLKYEIAEELGLLDRVLEGGWKSLTSKETGRIGGLMTKKRREIQQAEESEGKSKQE